jgi:glycosyltransferase involved in cell wall biosynthesis
MAIDNESSTVINDPLSSTVVLLARRLILLMLQLSLLLSLPLLVLIAFFVRIAKRTPADFSSRRVILGGCGLVNHAKWSQSLREIGIESRTFVWGTPSIYGKETFDFDLQESYGIFSYLMAPVFFIKAISTTDSIICGFDGFMLGTTNLRRFEIFLMKLAKCKVIIFPYGADAYVYRSIRSESIAHALQISYPDAARKQDSIERDVKRNVRKADFICLGIITFDGFGRWDALPVCPIVIDVEQWRPRRKSEETATVSIVHTPNHRGFKGTEFLVKAVSELQEDGLDIRLTLLEGVSNDEVRRFLTEEADILVEQLIAPGYALSGVEGLASGLTVIANLGDDRVFTPMRRWSYLDECPVVSSSPESIKETLRQLVENPALREQLSTLSREYALKYHSHATFQEFYAAIDGYLFEGQDSLINFYHPILGKSSRVKNRIQTPLIKNEI